MKLCMFETLASHLVAWRVDNLEKAVGRLKFGVSQNAF